MPVVLAKLLLLLACAAAAAFQITGRSWRWSRLRPALDPGSTALGTLFAVIIANNAMVFLSGLEVRWLGGELETATGSALFGVQLPVLLVTLTLVVAVFRELRRYLDHPGSQSERLRTAMLRTTAILLVSLPLRVIADDSGPIALAAGIAATHSQVVAIEVFVVAVAAWLRGEPRR